MKISVLLVTIILHVCLCFGQSTNRDTLLTSIISKENLYRDTIQNKQTTSLKAYQSIIRKLLRENKFLQISGYSSFLLHNQKKDTGKEFLFYFISIIILSLGIFKTFYSGYINNIFKVFFNTSLRQNQLTEILLQARLPSLLFNLFFTIIAGIYIWLILMHFNILQVGGKEVLIAATIAFPGIIYFSKFLVLKFLGWVTGMKQVTDTYIFVTFLINKIVTIVLIPFIILLAFSHEAWGSIIILLSFLVMGVLFLLRFFRSYGLIGNQLSASRFHFIIYLIAIEILPIFLIYKLLISSIV